MQRTRRTAATALALSLTLAAVAPRDAHAQLFFNGDGLGFSSASFVNHPLYPAYQNQVIFDLFRVGAGQSWSASAVFGDFAQVAAVPPVSTVHWQVRSGMSFGTGLGTVVASGSGVATIVGTRYTVAVTPFVLGAGDYWLGMYADLAGVAQAPGRSVLFFGVQETAGASSVNAVLDDSALQLLDTDAALNGGTVGGAPGADFSYGMQGQLVSAVVPEPGTWALLGTGLLSLAAVRRRRPS
jgi:hypothetical protein